MKNVICIHSEFMGKGDDILGSKLIGAFLKKVWAREDKAQTIIFYNSAVKLLCKGSDYLDVLDGLQCCGVELLACGTCLNSYKIMDDLIVGHVSNMEEITATLFDADKVITI